METARSAALTVLERCRKRGEWANEGLKKTLKGMEAREAALATRLVYGAVQNRMLLDAYLAELSTLPLEKLDKTVLDILRLGGYQILFMDQIPVRAAVDEAVKLTKARFKNPKTAGFVNAVLRNLDRRREELGKLLDGKWRAPGEERTRLSVQYSHPLWLVDELAAGLDGDLEETEQLLAANNAPAPMTVQVNTCRISVPALLKALEAEGVAAKEHPRMEGCLLLERTGDLEQLKPFQQGLFYVQDPAARAAVLAAAPKAGERVLDLCAAPGGKSFAAAVAMGGEGEIVSRDIYPRKVQELAAQAARLGFSLIRPEVGDATQAAEEGAYDLVIADVPCSGLGIIGKKPDIRYKDPAQFAGLSPIQENILENAAGAVKPGGRLLYATCTLRREENEGRTAAFLARRGGEFTLRREETLWPHRTGTDGFYFAVLERGAAV